MSSQRVKRKVSVILKEANITQPPVPIEELARSLGVQVQCGVLPDELSGLLYRKDSRKKPIIGVNSAHAKVRQRFTIAHELGHMILHDEPVHVDRGFSVKFRDARSSTAEHRAEIEANQFAAEILMPTQLIRNEIKKKSIDMGDDDLLHVLANRFQVSVQAMVFRLINLGYISDH